MPPIPDLPYCKASVVHNDVNLAVAKLSGLVRVVVAREVRSVVE